MTAPPASLQLLGPSSGGIRAHVATLAAALADRGGQVSTAGPAGVLDGVGHLDVVCDVPGLGRAWAIPAAARQLGDAVGAAEVVHAHGLKAGVLALSCRPRRPVVLTVHNLVIAETSGRAERAMRMIESGLLRRVDHVISVSPAIDERVAPHVPASRRSVIIPVAPAPVPRRSPEDVRRAHGVSPDAPLVVAAARLHPQKNLPLLVDAMADVVARVPDARLVVVGDGDERADLETRVRDAGLDGVVVLAGRSGHAVDELAAADVVAVSSNWEGSPIVVAEAVQLGRPVVSTDVGDVAELIVDGVSGRLVGVGDRAALATAIGDLLVDRDLAARLAAEGRRRAEARYEPGHLVDQVVDVYRSVVA